MSTTCLVDQYSYEVGMIGPAILVIIVLSFMRKRVCLRPDVCNGRPALPIPVDFLGRDRNRFTTVLAFGATAASCFAMFFTALTSGSVSVSIGKNLPKTPWMRAIAGILFTVVYGIINYPYVACLNADYKMIGYAMGLIYTFIRLIVDLFLYFGCSWDSATTQQYKQLDMGYLVYMDIVLNLPSVICTVLLVGGYAVRLYKELRKHYDSNMGLTCRDNQETTSDERIAEETDRNHVLLLLANRLYKKRILMEHEPFYVTLRNKIYERRSDFKFSTQFLSAYLVSVILIYQLTVVAGIMMDLFRKMVSIKTKSGLNKTMFLIMLDYAIVAVFLACFIAMLQLFFFLRSHRADVINSYKTRRGRLLPNEILHPKMLVGKSLRYCGYQIAYTAIGFVFMFIALFFLLSPVWILKIFDVLTGRPAVLALVKAIILRLLPLFFAPLLIWITMMLLCRFVFRDKTYPDLTVTIDNRRFYDIISYFFFFLNILVGLVSGLLRVVKGAALGLVFLCRLDRTSMMTGYRKWDTGYMAYVGFLNVLVAFKHPVMLCFCQLLIEERRRRYSGSSPERPRVSSKALNRWFLAVFLMRNPSLVHYRRQHVSDPAMRLSRPTEMTHIVLEETTRPIEHLQSTTSNY